MKISALALAASAVLGLAGATPAAADQHRTVVTQTRTVTVHRAVSNGQHNGWHKKKVRVCRNSWSHGQRKRACAWRYR
jgi:hypothetical protein